MTAVNLQKKDDAVSYAGWITSENPTLLDLFFHEHATPLTGNAKKQCERRLEEVAGAVFPVVPLEEVFAILRERRFVVLEGPPGTGKTRLAYQLADRVGSATNVQFHAARTYEDFVVGLFPRPENVPSSTPVSIAIRDCVLEARDY